MEEDASRIPAFLRQYGLVLGLLVVGLVFFIYGLMQFFGRPSSSDVTFETNSQVQPSGVIPSPSIEEIVVDIEGAVLHPGVYHLTTTSRLQDLLTKAGGFSKTVDHEKVAKGLNLAEKLSDGAKVYIPFVGEETTASVGQQATIRSGQVVLGTSTTTSGLINVNTASTEQLDTLPGVGSVTATKIISNRPYATIEDLVTKKAVGQATYDKLKDKVTIQ